MVGLFNIMKSLCFFTQVIEALEKKPIVVKAGETATIRIPYKGGKPPSATWIHEGEEILPVKASSMF